jgi:hypothetical protein
VVNEDLVPAVEEKIMREQMIHHYANFPANFLKILRSIFHKIVSEVKEVVNENLVPAVEEKIRREQTIHHYANFPAIFLKILRSLLHKIVSEVKEAVTTCIASQMASFYNEGIQNWCNVMTGVSTIAETMSKTNV